jgi:hypothetical protein
MLSVAPLAGRFGNRVTVPMLAVLLPAMLAGMVRRRLLTPAATA